MGYRIAEMTLADMLLSMTLAEIERWAIGERMKLCAGNKQLAAKSLGVCLKTLYNKLGKDGRISGPVHPYR